MLAASVFMSAYLEAKRKDSVHKYKSSRDLGTSTSSYTPLIHQLVVNKCPNCAAPNENSRINCEYCNSNLKLLPIGVE